MGSRVGSDKIARSTALASSSTAEQDAAAAARLGREPFLNSLALVSVSLDHLTAWRELVRTLQPAYAHMTLIRGALEAAVVGRWLIDPGVETAERLARARDWLREDYQKRRRVEEIIKAAYVPPARSAADRIAELESEADALHLRPLRNVNLTDLFRQHCSVTGDEGETIYATMSSFAHGRPWSQLLAERTVLGPGVHGAGTLGTIAANDSQSLGFTAVAVRTTTLAIDDLEGYTGIK